jgi:hypothetical protein
VPTLLDPYMDNVERGPDGELRWVRPAPARPHQDRAKFVQERRGRRSHGGFTSDHSRLDGQTRRGLPSFLEIERLLGIYVATGEGQGAFLAAKVSEETKGPYYSYENEIEIVRRYDSRPGPRPLADSSGSSSEGDPRPGRPPPRPTGGPEGPVGPARGPAYTEGRPPVVLRPTRRYDEDRVHIVGRRPTYAPGPRDDRVWIPLRMTRDDDRRFLRVEEYDPMRRAEYEPDFADAAYIDDLGPQSINTPRPAHTRAERVIRRTEERIVDQAIGGPAAPGRRRYQAHVDDVSEHEDGRGPVYADLPPQENDLRTNTQTGSLRRRISSGRRITNRTVMRGGGGLDYDPEEARSDGDGPNFLRLRGGGPGAQPPTGTSALAPDSDEIDTEPRKIE